MGVLRGALLVECALVMVMVLTALPPAMGAVYKEIVTDPDHPGTCRLRGKGSRGIIMKKGEKRALPHCMSVFCNDDGKDMVLDYHTCGTTDVLLDCRHPIRDMSKPYPYCCYMTCKQLKQPSRVRAERRVSNP